MAKVLNPEDIIKVSDKFVDVDTNEFDGDYDPSYDLVYDDKKGNAILPDSGAMNQSLEQSYMQIHQQTQKLGKVTETYDWKTKNKSFLDLYQDLYKLGVKNNKFFLRIYDTDLIGVDPYAPYLPLEIQAKIFIECIRNPWYFLREVARIPEDGKPIVIGGGAQYRIDRNNLAGWYCTLNGIDNYRSKPRQTGKTQDCACQVNYVFHFGTMATNFTFGNKKQEDALLNLSRLKTQRDMLPAYLQMRLTIDEKGKMVKAAENVKSIKNPVNNNTIGVLSSANSYEKAMSMGRGLTSAFQWYDEFDFTPYNSTIIDSSVFAYSTASENARKNGAMYGRLFSSTPGDLDTQWGTNATKFISKMLKWKDEFLDLPINKLRKIITSKDYNGVMFIEHTWRQLKKSVKWYENQCRLVQYNATVIAREIDLKRIRGSSSSPFKEEDLLYISNNIKQPIGSVDYSSNLCPINLYEALNKNYPYIMAIDTSDSLGQDNNAMTLINPYTLKAAAEYRSPYISAKNYFIMLDSFLREYCPRSLIVIENNRRTGLLDLFIESVWKQQLYYDVEKMDAKPTEKVNEYGAEVLQAMARRAYGFSTTAGTRNLMFGILENIMEEDKSVLVSEYVINDILGLIRKPNGKIEAGPGNHDDSLMSYLIGLCVYHNSKNLEEFGIIRGAREPQVIDTSDPQYVRDKVRELMMQLPEEMRKEFNFVNKDERAEEWNYYKNIDALQKRNAVAERNIQLQTGNNQYQSPDDMAIINSVLEESIFRSNAASMYNSGYDDYDDYGTGNNNSDFDIDDYI